MPLLILNHRRRNNAPVVTQKPTKRNRRALKNGLNGIVVRLKNPAIAKRNNWNISKRITSGCVRKTTC
jgi:hypothetical protein